MRKLALAVLFLASCKASCAAPPKSLPDADASASTPSVGSIVVVSNATPKDATVFVSFGSNSQVTSFPFCQDSGGPGPCVFTLTAQTTQSLLITGQYLNATVSFNTPPSCGQTVTEMSINTPNGFDTADVSLVNGYSNKISVTVSAPDAGLVTLGPPKGQTGNETVFGVFPYGCDLCTARQNPPCGIPADAGADASGCKAGTQYKPAVPCQYDPPSGSVVTVSLVP